MVTTDVTSTRVTNSTEVHVQKEKEKKKESCKKRNEKRTLAGLQVSLPAPKQLTSSVKIETNQQTTIDVHHKRLEQTSSGEDSGVTKTKVRTYVSVIENSLNFININYLPATL